MGVVRLPAHHLRVEPVEQPRSHPIADEARVNVLSEDIRLLSAICWNRPGFLRRAVRAAGSPDRPGHGKFRGDAQPVTPRCVWPAAAVPGEARCPRCGRGGVTSPERCWYVRRPLLRRRRPTPGNAAEPLRAQCVPPFERVPNRYRSAHRVRRRGVARYGGGYQTGRDRVNCRSSRLAEPARSSTLEFAGIRRPW